MTLTLPGAYSALLARWPLSRLTTLTINTLSTDQAFAAAVRCLTEALPLLHSLVDLALQSTAADALTLARLEPLLGLCTQRCVSVCVERYSVGPEVTGLTRSYPWVTFVCHQE